jgi:hypothetical protein
VKRELARLSNVRVRGRTKQPRTFEAEEEEEKRAKDSRKTGKRQQKNGQKTGIDDATEQHTIRKTVLSEEQKIATMNVDANCIHIC